MKLRITNYLFEGAHLEESDLFRREESPFAASYVFLGQSGKRDPVEVDHFVSHFLKDTAYDAVLPGVDLQSNVMAVSFGELECIGYNPFVIKHDAGTYDSFVHFLEVTVEGDGVHFLLVELRMRQFGSQVTVIGKEEHAGGVSIKPSDGVDTLGAGIADDVDDGVPFLRVVGRGDGVLGFIEKDIYLAFASYGLVVETDLISRQDFDAERVHDLSVDGDDTGLDKIIRLATGADARVGEEFIESYGLGGVLVQFVVSLLFACGIESVVTLRTFACGACKRTVLRAVKSVLAVLIGVFKRTLCLFSVPSETRARSSLGVTPEAWSGLMGNRFILSAETGTRVVRGASEAVWTADTVIVGIVVH